MNFLTLFFCPICMRLRKFLGSEKGREGSCCNRCNSTSRERAVVFAVKREIFKSKILFKPRFIVVGIADSNIVETHLKKILGESYTNYHYHKDPRIDITKISHDCSYDADLVLCSDVLEHVARPVSKAFEGLNRILTRRGKLVISVPYTNVGTPHVEHFPILSEFSIRDDGRKILFGIDSEGNSFESTNLIFHGGEGEVLEFRIFSESSLFSYLELSGFYKVKKIFNNRFLGIQWEPWSRVWLATKR